MEKMHQRKIFNINAARIGFASSSKDELSKSIEILISLLWKSINR